MVANSFFFYDLETSGVNPRSCRIMQFAGQRTGMDLNPVGEPYDILIKISEDILPEPDAILITGITPQKTIADGITEAEFLKIFDAEINQEGTIFVGFNSIRFDDEFMRFTRYRNFYDPYEWQWKDGRGRWDILDVARMTRALRPGGIQWPFGSDGKPTNRLELLADVNKLDHHSAHDALSDVLATIDVARLIRDKQPRLFDYLLSMRDKKKVETLVNGKRPFVYTSGKYAVEFEKTTIAIVIGPQPDRQAVLVYDLRHDPSQFLAMKPEQLAEIWKYNKDPEALRLPVKTLQFNRCPAVAPLNVLDPDSQKRLGLDMASIEKHRRALETDPEFIKRLHIALQLANQEREQTTLVPDERQADTRLYEEFIPDGDKRQFSKLHNSPPEKLAEFIEAFSDQRLKALVPLYKARNFAKSLTSEEREAWEAHRKQALLGGGQNSRAAKFGQRLSELSGQKKLTGSQEYLLKELELYAESIMPDFD